MLNSSLDAIRKLLIDNFPDVSKIYVNKVPDGFKRPSFFVEFIDKSSEDLSNVIYNMISIWQIVYFAPKNNTGNIDAFNQFSVSDILFNALKSSASLIGPDGNIFSVLEVDGGPRDNEVYVTIKLEAQGDRTQQTYIDMGQVNLNLKEE